MRRELYIEVPGVAIPQGSMRSFNGHITHANSKLKQWRSLVADRLSLSVFTQGMFAGAVYAYLFFGLPRPKSCNRDRPHVRPDCDKLARAILDAATDARVWSDDGQVTEMHVFKRYVREGEEPYVAIYFRELGG